MVDDFCFGTKDNEGPGFGVWILAPPYVCKVDGTRCPSANEQPPHGLAATSIGWPLTLAWSMALDLTMVVLTLPSFVRTATVDRSVPGIGDIRTI